MENINLDLDIDLDIKQKAAELLNAVKNLNIVERIETLENKLISTAAPLDTEARAMKNHINSAIKNIKYLNSDYKDLKEALRVYWYKWSPDVLGALKQCKDMAKHTAWFGNSIKQILLSMQDNLLPDMKKILQYK